MTTTAERVAPARPLPGHVFGRPDNDVLVLDTSDFDQGMGLRTALQGRSEDQPLLLLLERSELPELRRFLTDHLLTDFLVKPFDDTTLRARTRKLLAMAEELQCTHQRLNSAQLRIERLAACDGLTGLPTSAQFSMRLQARLDASSQVGERVAVGAITLNCLDAAKHALGLGITDQLLGVISRRLRSVVRGRLGGDPLLTRLDGDRFLMVVEGAQQLRAVELAIGDICAELGRPFVVKGHEISPVPRAGVSMFPADARTAAALVGNAQTALEFGSHHGQRECYFYSRTMDEGVVERLGLENRLRDALQREAFELRYQPKVETGSGQTVGLEALLRWPDSRFGDVSPAEFIPVAEETGLITELTQFVLEAVCSQLRDWQGEGVPVVPVSVNLSARDLANPELPGRVRRVLTEAGVRPGLLELEVTEGALITDLGAAVARLEELHEIGITIALDDFGTGYSSLSYLHRIPIDTLKIDRSFIRNVTNDWNSAAITSTVITLSHVLNLKVVAEGVETHEQLELLMDQRCDQIQGALFSMPMAAESARRWLTASAA